MQADDSGMTIEEYGESIKRQNAYMVEQRLWTAVRWTVVLVFLGPIAVFLTNIDRGSDWYDIRVGIQVFTIVEALVTGFAWLWWRGERQNAEIECGFLRDGDIWGLGEYRFQRDKPWERF